MLCVAFNHTFHTDFYEVAGKEYKKLKSGSKLNALLGRDQDWYIIGTGFYHTYNLQYRAFLKTDPLFS